MVKEGKMTTTSAQYPSEMGRSLDAAYKYLNGEQVEHEIKVPVKLLTKNVETDGNKDSKQYYNADQPSDKKSEG